MGLKAVIPIGGLGTRFFPASKAVSKELFPVIDKPVIQFVVNEASGAGCNCLLMVTGKNLQALDTYMNMGDGFSVGAESSSDDTEAPVQNSASEALEIFYVGQGLPLGLGHAVLKAKSFITNEPFVVLLGDEIVVDGSAALRTMIELSERFSASVVALMEVTGPSISNYGVPTMGDEIEPGIFKILDLHEKPIQSNAASSYAVVGRYVFQPGIFAELENLGPGRGGEIQLSDAISRLARNPNLAGPVVGYVVPKPRYDMGDKLSFLQATVELGANRKDIGPAFLQWLRGFIAP
jgi:UTP--glucose-1-phosphate uridylyltransferase